jgi:hypothetical protein
MIGCHYEDKHKVPKCFHTASLEEAAKKAEERAERAAKKAAKKAAAAGSDSESEASVNVTALSSTTVPIHRLTLTDILVANVAIPATTAALILATSILVSTSSSAVTTTTSTASSRGSISAISAEGHYSPRRLARTPSASTIGSPTHHSSSRKRAATSGSSSIYIAGLASDSDEPAARRRSLSRTSPTRARSPTPARTPFTSGVTFTGRSPTPARSPTC